VKWSKFSLRVIMRLLMHIFTHSFDTELPLEVDDEYWENEDGTPLFRQPPGKPSKVAAYNLWLRLTEISAFTLRTFVGSASISSSCPLLISVDDI